MLIYLEYVRYLFALGLWVLSLLRFGVWFGLNCSVGISGCVAVVVCLVVAFIVGLADGRSLVIWSLLTGFDLRFSVLRLTVFAIFTMILRLYF